jgi:hypothetical protein
MSVLTAYHVPLQMTPLLGYLLSCVVWMTGVMKVFGMEGSFEDFYSPLSVQKIHLSIDAADLRKMKEALPERIYVPATMRWRNLEIPNVGVRFKGDSSSQPQQTHKRSYLIKFSHYETDQRFLGMERVALDNGVQFGSLFSEPIVTEILRDLNIPASHCNHAQLFLNGEDHGVYVNVERIDESFLQRCFGSASGALYKVHQPGPGANLAEAGPRLDDYKSCFSAKTEKAKEAYADLVGLIQALGDGKNTPYEQVLGSQIVADDFLKTMAVMLLAGCFDQLTGWNPHNYYLYRHPMTQRWHYLPWDLDVGLADNAFGKIPVIEGWHAAWPIPGGPPKPILENIVNHPKLLANYRSDARSILATYFKPEHLKARLRKWYSLIEEPLRTDPFPARRATNPEDTGYESILDSIERFMEKRYALAAAQLKDPGERPKTIPQGHHLQREPQPGTLPHAPSDLRILSRDATSIELEWQVQTKEAVGHIVQRALKEEPLMFHNHIPCPGPSQSHAVDERIDPEATYLYRVYAVFPSPEGPAGSLPSEATESSPLN